MNTQATVAISDAHIAVNPADTIDFVTNALRKNGATNPEYWKRYLDGRIHNEEYFGAQRFLINRSLRRLFADDVSKDTTAARFCLVDKGSKSDWEKLIVETVAPVAVKHGFC